MYNYSTSSNWKISTPETNLNVKSLYIFSKIFSNIKVIVPLLIIVLMSTSSFAYIISNPQGSMDEQSLEREESNVEISNIEASMEGFRKINQYESDGKLITIYHPDEEEEEEEEEIVSDNTNSDTKSETAIPNVSLQTMNHNQEYYGCSNPRKDILVVDNQMYRYYYPLHGFTHDTIPASDFHNLTPEEIIQYRVIILEPNWQNEAIYKQGLQKVMTALSMSSCLVVGMRVANQIGMLIDIDPLGTDFDDTTYHNIARFVEADPQTHPFITGLPWGSLPLLESDFQNWQYTDLGELYNLPTTQPGYREIMKSNSGGPTMIEYSFARGHVVLDIMSDFGGAWGTGNSYVAENYLKYLNFTSYQIQAPTLTFSPGNVTYKENTQGNELTWQFVDQNPSSYNIELNGAPYESSILWLGQPITTNIDDLSRGTYNFTVSAIDLTGRVGRDTVFVTVIDGTVPTFSTLPNTYNYAFGTVGHSLSWIANDETLPDFYAMWLDDVPIDYGPWNDGVPIIQSIDGLGIGTHNYTIQVFDKAVNFATDTVNVNVVLDFSAPVIETSPGNQSYSEGTTGNEITWVVSDQFSSGFLLWLDDVLIGSGPWQSSVELTGNIDGFNYGLYNMTILFYDTSGNSVSETIWINVIDTDDPKFVATPSNINYETGDQGTYTLTWIVNDSNPDVFTLEKDGSEILTAGWNSNDAINVNVGGLPLGSYSYSITFYDVDGNFVQDSASVTVVDTTLPLISGSPSLSYEQGSTGNTLTWFVIDLNPDNYIIYYNSSSYAAGSWSSSNPIVINVDGLDVGFHNFTLQIFDTSDNQETYTSIVSITDTVNPTISGTLDYSYEVLSEGHNITWVATDNNPFTHKIYRNNQLIASGSWTSGEEVTINIDGLSTNVYNYTIIVYDTSTNFNISTVWITVIDTTDPMFNSIPSDLSYSEGTTGNTLSWIATDPNPTSYEIRRDGDLIASGTWFNNAPITINVDGLSLGIFEYNLTIFDFYGNSAWDAANVSIISNPTFRLSPVDVGFTNDTTGNTITWIIEDLTPGYYNITLNGVLTNTSTPWTSGTPIIHNVDTTVIGEYNYTIFANDTDGNIVSDWVIVTVTDNPWFEFDPGSADTYVEGNSGNTLTWDPIDTEPSTYELLKNGTQFDSGAWNNTDNIIINIDGLTKGFYNFTLVIYDLSDNFAKHEVIVSVTDETNPTILGPNDSTINETSTGYTLSWDVFDNYPATYSITNNSLPYRSGSWNSDTNITINIDDLNLGTHTLVLTVYDSSGNSNSDTVIITVIDVTNPSVDQPSNFSYEEGSIGKEITWDVGDLHPDWYVIYQNSTSVFNSTWSGLSSISYNVDGLSLGFYEFKIYLNDTTGNFVEDIVIVEVRDMTAPSVSDETDFSYEQGDTGNQISWLPIDTNPDYYFVYQNSSIVDEGLWTNNTLITIPVDGLDLGFYQYKIYLNDTSGNFIEDILILQVTDTTAPSITPASDETYEDETSSYQISWVVSDYNPHHFWIIQNQTLIDQGTWSIGNIFFDIGGYDAGWYNFTLYLNDTQGLISFDEIILHVIDTIDPSFSSASSNFNVEQGDDTQFVMWTFTDENPASYDLEVDEVYDHSGTWISNDPIIISIPILALNEHNFTLIVYDDYGGFAVHTILVTIIDTTAPTFSEPIDNSYLQFSSGNEIVWNLTDYNADSYNITREGFEIATGTWSNGELITQSIDTSSIGSFTYRIYANDTEGNISFDEVLITITDPNPPTLDGPNDLIYEYGSTGNELSWSAADTNEDYYEIFIDGVYVTNGTWSSITNITFSVDGFELGSFSIRIDVYDLSNNIISDTVIVNVVDTIDPMVNQPSDYSYEYGSTGNEISWMPIDDNPHQYVIYLNDTNVQSSTWSNNTLIAINIDSLNLGFYEFKLYLNDTSGNFVEDIMIISVIDTTAPTFDFEQSDETIEERETNVLLKWNASDSFPDNYEIYVDGSIYTPGTYSNEDYINFQVGGFGIGVYNISIIVFDTSGNNATSWMILTVEDTSIPDFQSVPTDITYFEGSSGNAISFTIDDDQPNYFELLVNGTVHTNGTWFRNVPFLINIDGLTKGYYNLTLVAFDLTLNMATYTIYVTVLDNTIPTFTQIPVDASFEEGKIGNSISWTLFENYPLNYSLLENGIQLENGTWTSNTAITYEISSLKSAGIYNFTLIVWDETQNYASDSVIVTIVDLTAPEFVSLPLDLDEFINETNLEVYWVVTDNHPSSYSILSGGEPITSGVWQSGINIVLDLSNFVVGVYNVTIIVYDQSNNAVMDYVIIKLKDPAITETINPEFDLVPNVYEGDVESITGIWITKEYGDPISNGIITVILYDLSKTQIFDTFSSTTDSNGNFELFFNYTGLLPRNYTWVINFEKDSYESWNFEIPVRVRPHTYIIEIQAPDTLERGEKYFITATVYYNNSVSSNGSLSLNQLNSRNGRAGGVELEFTVFVTYLDGRIATFKETVTTLSTGVGIIEFSGEDTRNMASIDSIGAQVLSDFGEPSAIEIAKEELPLVVDAPPVFIEALFAQAADNIYIILLILTSIIALIGLFIYLRRSVKKKYKVMLREMDTAKIEFEGLTSIRAVIIQTQEGVPAYDVRIGSGNVEASLISGVVTAISAFLSEFSSEELFGFETMQRQGLSITSHKGQLTKLIVISDEELPMIILDKISKAHSSIEEKYKFLFLDFTGDQLNHEELMEIFDKAGLHLQIQGKSALNERNIRRIMKIKSVSRLIKDQFRKLPRIFDETEDGFLELDELLDIMEDEWQLSSETIARILLLGYKNEIILPQLELNRNVSN